MTWQFLFVTGLIILISLSYTPVDGRPSDRTRPLETRDYISNTCSPPDRSALYNGLMEAHAMADNMGRRTADYRIWLQAYVNNPTARGHPTEAQGITYRYFLAMFGRTFWSPHGPDAHRNINGDGLKFVDDVIAIARSLTANILNQRIGLDYYCDDSWLADFDPNGIARLPPFYYDRRVRNNPVPGWRVLPSICREKTVGRRTFPPDLEAFVIRGPEYPDDVMMLCPVVFNLWSRNLPLSVVRQTTFATGSKTLDDFRTSSPGRLLIHELTHSPAILGNNFTNDPIIHMGLMINGVPNPINPFNPSCYAWWGVQAVAYQNGRENQMEAIGAAENNAYFALALFLERNEWANGIAHSLPSP